MFSIQMLTIQEALSSTNLKKHSLKRLLKILRTLKESTEKLDLSKTKLPENYLELLTS